MSDLGAAAALVLAVVFAWAGAAKLVAPAMTTSSFAQLGLPAPRALAVTVPVVELSLAALLVIGVRWAALGLLVLLVAFTAVLVRSIHAGQQVVCSCFGGARAEPVTVLDVARNGMLAVLALLAIAGAGSWPSLPALVLVSSVSALAWVALSVAALARTAPLWPGQPER